MTPNVNLPSAANQSSEYKMQRSVTAEQANLKKTTAMAETMNSFYNTNNHGRSRLTSFATKEKDLQSSPASLLVETEKKMRLIENVRIESKERLEMSK